ncbi:hypothetical protein F2Q70_00002861 [Brassica cretica]|uniref:Uncharacterized protein n=1 Tax=Brassica cretica TaxID=69181 RepID=A0A8S9ILC8_BRACR|nr:hypothetical protein F2Q70_00002861 [Brassica cretica]
MAPLPLSCVYAAPPLVGPASSVGEGELAEWRSRYSLPSSLVLRIPTLEERASSYIPGEIAVYEAFFDSSLRGTIPGLIAAIQNFGDLEYLSLVINEVLFAYHLAPFNGGEGRFHLRPRSGLPIMEELPKSDRKGPPELILLLRKERKLFSGRDSFLRIVETCREALPMILFQPTRKLQRSACGDEVMITGSRRSPVVKLDPSPSLPGKRPKRGGVTTRSAQQSVDIARSAGSLATALSNLNLNVFPQDGTVLPIGDSSEVSGEKEQCVAREFEIHDLKEKVKDLEKVAEASSADGLAMNQKNQELEEDIEALKAAAETFKFEMVMAVNGARVVARWELMRALEQYKAVVQEEARSKGAPLPTFEDEPAIPPSSDMDVDSSVKLRGSPT